MKKASLILTVIFMIISLFSCNEGSRAVKDAALTEGNDSGDTSGDISDVDSGVVVNGGVNIALGKSCTFTGIYTEPSTGKELYADSKDKKLTDGVIGKRKI
jgi:hypothetical protein